MTLRPLIAALGALVLFGAPASAGDYPSKTLLVEPAELAKPKSTFLTVDAREKAKYEAGHIPGSVWVDHAAWAKAFGDGTDAKGWSERITEIGVFNDQRIVVYDDNQSKDAARIWWILRYWGVKDVRLLNGGWKGWTAGKFPTDKEPPLLFEYKHKAVAQVDRLATKEFLLGAIEGGKLQIVDARSEKEFCGTDKLTNKKGGAMPGAKQLEWTDLLEADTQRFKSADDLKKLFAEAGIALDQPTATHCQSGGRASVMAFGLELMGAKEVRNYYKSWGEWGNADDTPIVPGKVKEKR